MMVVMKVTKLSKLNERIDESWQYLVNIRTRKSGSGLLRKESKNQNKNIKNI